MGGQLLDVHGIVRAEILDDDTARFFSKIALRAIDIQLREGSILSRNFRHVLPTLKIELLVEFAEYKGDIFLFGSGFVVLGDEMPLHDVFSEAKLICPPVIMFDKAFVLIAREKVVNVVKTVLFADSR